LAPQRACFLDINKKNVTDRNGNARQETMDWLMIISIAWTGRPASRHRSIETTLRAGEHGSAAVSGKGRRWPG